MAKNDQIIVISGGKIARVTKAFACFLFASGSGSKQTFYESLLPFDKRLYDQAKPKH